MLNARLCHWGPQGRLAYGRSDSLIAEGATATDGAESIARRRRPFRVDRLIVPRIRAKFRVAVA
jgi:hypothetical protein